MKTIAKGVSRKAAMPTKSVRQGLVSIHSVERETYRGAKRKKKRPARIAPMKESSVVRARNIEKVLLETDGRWVIFPVITA